MARRPTLIDTFFLVALINERDQYHQEAVELSRLYEGEPLVVTQAVLLEVGNALARGYKAEAVSVMETLLTAPEIEVLPLTVPLFERAFNLYRSHLDKEWGLVDCISFVVMADLGITDALTLDQHFAQAGFRILMSRRDAG